MKRFDRKTGNYKVDNTISGESRRRRNATSSASGGASTSAMDRGMRKLSLCIEAHKHSLRMGGVIGVRMDKRISQVSRT